MNQVALYDSEIKKDLVPFSLTRHVADIRVGILTIREKWESILGQPIATSAEKISQSYNFPANLVPSQKFIASLLENDFHSNGDQDSSDFKIISYPWNIFQFNDWALRQDFGLLTKNRSSGLIPASVQTIKPDDIFLEDGAKLSHCILNASGGPIYIGKDAEIMEGSTIRGPFALCEGAVVKMGTRIYGATTIGPFSVVGGEIKNSVIFGYSNKGHDGYIGDSVLGEWCNLGAGTTTSNLKNNLGEVRVTNAPGRNPVNAGIKCGLLMGDYSRSAINTSFNTGTTVGISANVFGVGLTPTFIPDFSWGYNRENKYEIEKAIRDIDNWKKLKARSFTEHEQMQLRNIFNQT